MVLTEMDEDAELKLILNTAHAHRRRASEKIRGISEEAVHL